MKSPSLHPAVLDPLDRLTRRVRWKRWLAKLHRLAWLLALAFLVLFVADLLFGLRTLGLRIAFGATLAAAVALFAVDWIAAWLGRIDLVGLAHLLEKRYPDLSERLVTLVQIEADKTPSSLAPLLEAETTQKLAGADPHAACPLTGERKAWTRTVVLLGVLFVGLSFVPAFGAFADRFFSAWVTPLVPYEIEVTHGNGYALRGGSYAIEATVQMLDDNAEAPTEFALLCEDDAGATTAIPMKATTAGRFAVTLENLRQPLRCRVQAGEAVSSVFAVGLIVAPVFTEKPWIFVLPPKYVAGSDEKSRIAFDADGATSVLEYSLMSFALSLDRWPDDVAIHVKKLSATDEGVAEEFRIEVRSRETSKPIVALQGTYQAELVLKLEHGLSTTLPLGQWTVRADTAPRFTQPLRLYGGDSALRSSREYRIAPGDAIKLQTTVEDDEGLDAVAIEFRVNDVPLPIKKWLDARGEKQFVINDWLPLPTTLKEKDRVQFRIRASDKRHLQKGTLPGALPAGDLLPQVTVAPAAAAGEDAWITLRVDQSVDAFVKQQAQAQADEVRDIIGKLIEKVRNEIEQVQQLQRPIHQQFALTPAQMKKAEELRAVNRDVEQDLLHAAEHFSANPELGRLAEHFLEIAETDMKKSADALQRFSDKDRSLPEAEKELQASQDALLQARKKLERMLEWNKLLAQDRLDRFQIEKLLKRQQELADRLKDLLANEPMSDAEMAKQIEAIRQEQAKIAEQTAQLQEQSRLVQDSLAALQQERLQQMAKAAEQLAAEQRARRELDPDKMPADLKERLGKLAERQAELAQRVEPFAQKNEGPDVKPAQAAADALKKPLVEEALAQQKEHEKRLQDWVTKLVPGKAVNALREQILQLAKKQQAIRVDLERLVPEAPQLDFNVLQQRLRDLTARQKEMPAAIAKLPIDDKDQRLQPAQKSAELTAQQAAEQLALENAAGAPAAYELMRKAQQELEALAAMMPTTLPIDRKEIKDASLRAKIDKVEAFAKEQEKLRAETERLLADWMKAGGQPGKDPLREKADKLAADLLELSQKGGPEVKAMAKESAHALDAAKKAMDAGQALKAKGDGGKAKMMDDDAAKQLDIVAKQLAKFAQDQASKAMPKDANAKTAEALKASSDEMRKAEDKLPAMPKDAQIAMKSAAKSLEQASQQAGQQSAKKLPKAARGTPAKSSNPLMGVAPGSLPKTAGLDPSIGKAWGEMPGELKTRMLQDIRARYGEDYAEMIRQYFERLAETPTAGRKE